MYLAKRDFSMGGVEYRKGDELPINEYRAASMRDEGFVMTEEEAKAWKAEKSKSKSAAKGVVAVATADGAVAVADKEKKK